MKLIDPETNKEYEFEETHFVSSLNGDYQRGTLKPVDSWPKVQSSYYYYDNSGEVYEDEWEGYEVDQKRKEQGNCFRTKQEAEYARDRIKSLQKAKVLNLMEPNTRDGVDVIINIPKKYLKAWEELQDE